MNIPAKQIVQLLGAEHPPELRRAAVLVLTEVGGRDGEIGQAIRGCLHDEDAGVRVAVLRAVGKLKIESALSDLLERIRHGGEEADLAAQAAARLGARGTKALQDLMPKVAPGLRRYIASALAGGGTASAETAAVHMLLDTDPGVVEATAKSFLAQIPTLTSGQKKTLAGELLELLEGKPSSHAEAAAVRLLIALEDSRATNVLWERIQPSFSPTTRATSLQALAKWVEEPSKEQLKRLFTCAADPDFRVAAPALMILQPLPADARTRAGWLSLLRAPDKSVRLVAVEKVGDQNTAEVADELLEQLSHPDRGLREAALERLTKLDRGRQALTKALLDADTPDRAWSLAKAQAPFVKDYPASWRKTVFDKACGYLEKEDRRSDALFFLLREADASELRDNLEERAVAHRKKKAYEKALTSLRLLARDPACAFPVRFELAACGLKVSAKDLTSLAREDDPSLTQFTGLIQHHEDELFPMLEKTKWLDPDDLYYLGFHFVEKDGAARKFGAQVLRLLLKRSPKGKLAQAAKSKLRSQGVE
jgi:HEAT repeat protein